MAKRAAKRRTADTDPDQQPAQQEGEYPRKRKKKAKADKTPPHWNVGDTSEPLEQPAAVHLAKCGECAAAVKFQPSASGHGMTVIERYGVDVDTAFGLSDAGLPICPNGHGEMPLADESMTASEAIRSVVDKIGSGEEAHQPELFETSKPFNFEGAYRELEAMSVEVSRLHDLAEDDKKRASDSKKSWEEASKRRDTAALEFRRRRQDKERKDAQQADAQRDAAEKLVLRLGALDVPFDAATARALSDEERGTLEAWLLYAEQHADEREQWMASRPTTIGGTGADLSAVIGDDAPAIDPPPVEQPVEEVAATV